MEVDDVTLPVSVRMPEAIYRAVKADAGRKRRSMNSQIIVLIEQALLQNQKAEAAVTAPAQ